MIINFNEEALRDLYKKKLVLGEVQGPLTGKPSVDKVWLQYYSDEQILYELPHMTIYEYLYNVNKDYPNQVAVQYYGTTQTFGEFFRKIDECAKAFLEIGVKKGDIVGICMPNTPETVIAFYALNKIGAVANMIHPLSGAEEIKDFLNETNCKIVVSTDIAYNKMRTIMNHTNIEKNIVTKTSNSMPLYMKIAYKLGVESKFGYKIEYDKTNISWNEFMRLGKLSKKDSYSVGEPKDLAVIFHTGGTTGKSKGVKITNDNFNCSITQSQIDNDIVERGESLLAIMPMFHGFGSSNCVHLALCSGVSIILVPKFDAKNCHKLIRKYKPNHILGVPSLFEAIMNNKKMKGEDLSYLKYLISGGDKLKEKAEKAFAKFLKEHNAKQPLLKAYGLTEAVAATTRTHKDMNDPNCVGIPFVKNNYKIVKSGTTEEVGYGIIGEICINGPSVMEGYYNNIEETNLVLKSHDDGKLWLHTGDLGYIDEKGNIFFDQREKRLIITNGYNVYPSQIEELIEGLPFVKKCIVIGGKHDKKSEVPIVYITLEKNCKLDDAVITERIRKICELNLPKYALPYEVFIKDKLPMTLMNKVNFISLEKEYEELQGQKKLKLAK